jgi:hypothetical protein
MNNKPEDFKVYHHASPKKESCYSWTSVNVLPELIGKEWNEISMCYVLSLEPVAIRVSEGMVTLDSCAGRITVIVTPLNKIVDVTKEVRIPVPGKMTAYDLRQALDENKAR